MNNNYVDEDNNIKEDLYDNVPTISSSATEVSPLPDYDYEDLEEFVPENYNQIEYGQQNPEPVAPIMNNEVSAENFGVPNQTPVSNSQVQYNNYEENEQVPTYDATPTSNANIESNNQAQSNNIQTNESIQNPNLNPKPISTNISKDNSETEIETNSNENKQEDIKNVDLKKEIQENLKTNTSLKFVIIIGILVLAVIIALPFINTLINPQ